MGLGGLVRRLLPAKVRQGMFPNTLFASEAKWEAKALLRHYRRAGAARARFKGKTGIRAHVGCGFRVAPGWDNLDLLLLPDVTCWDCRRGLPFEDSSVSLIFSEHVFEHLDRPGSTAAFLAECLRCLEPGGILRLVVPDCGMYLKAYASRDWDTLVAKRPLQRREGGYYDAWLNETYRTPMELVNAVFRQGAEHKYAYDAETLILDLEAAGFSSATQQAFGKSLSAAMTLDSPDRESESLYVEGVKPALA